MQPLAPSGTGQFEESIQLSPEEKQSLQTRKQMTIFRSSTPVPCLWVTARVDGSISGTNNAALEKLRTDLWHYSTSDNIAGAYREFLQKQLIRLNNKLLRYKRTGLCFHFRGTLERNACDFVGRHLHYHFSLWAPNQLFKTEPTLLQATTDALIEIWHQRVCGAVTNRYKPIHVDIITSSIESNAIAGYEAKCNPMTHGYEIFDDWSLAGCPPIAH